MDRSIFRRQSRESPPLLPQHESPYSHPMTTLAPRPYSDTPTTASARSRSPPLSVRSPDFPSRFRDGHVLQAPSLSSSRSRDSQRSSGRVQFEQIPPPITSSMLLRTPLGRTGTTSSRRGMHSSALSSSHTLRASIHGPTDPLMPLHRREKAIQTDLQLLLDAQSMGLVQGRGGHDFDQGSDGGSSTPTSQSAFLGHGRERARSRDGKGGQVVPVRQPRKKPISLRAARRGILAAVEELGEIKAEEENITNSSRETLLHLLSQLNNWSQKISDFSTEMAKIHDGAENREVAELQNEKSAVENEIQELEERLFALRARDRNLGARIGELKNQREAKISSFREGRRGVDAELKVFLYKPPVDDIIPVLEHAYNGKGKNVPDGGSEVDEMGDIFLSLPPKRRTLEVAKSWLSTSASMLASQTSSIQKERAALEEGAAMWEECVKLVTDFEDDLRAQMKAGAGNSDSGNGVTVLRGQISKMDEIVEQLEGKVQRAESEGWNLLICAIGAELEAFKEGRNILEGLLQTLQPPEHTENASDLLQQVQEEYHVEADSGVNGDQETSKLDDPTGTIITTEGLRNGTAPPDDDATPKPPGLERFDTAREAAEYKSESEDDGPHPDLLISHEDDDDEPHPNLLVSRGLD